MGLLIYTSGTTGAPKGIIYDHKFLTHTTYFFARQCEMGDTSVGMLKSPFFWGAGVYEMYPALTHGGTLVVTDRDGHKRPDYLAKTLFQERVTVLMIVPSVLDLLLDIHEGQST